MDKEKELYKEGDVPETQAEPEDIAEGAGEGSPAGQGPSEEAEEASEGSGQGTEDKDSIIEKPDSKDLKIAELNDKYMRLFAEFDNFRKRSETEKAGMFAEGERTVLLKVLPLIDNFERALGSLPEDQRQTSFAEGIDKIYRAFADQLKEIGVTQIEAVGQQFDANLHNAVMHVEDDTQPDNVVIEEFQKGYMFRDRVLRYSMVKVAN